MKISNAAGAAFILLLAGAVAVKAQWTGEIQPLEAGAAVLMQEGSTATAAYERFDDEAGEAARQAGRQLEAAGYLVTEIKIHEREEAQDSSMLPGGIPIPPFLIEAILGGPAPKKFSVVYSARPGWLLYSPSQYVSESFSSSEEAGWAADVARRRIESQGFVVLGERSTESACYGHYEPEDEFHHGSSWEFVIDYVAPSARP